MKHLFAILLFALCINVTGLAQELRNSSHAVVAKIERDGTVRDKSNFRIGKIESDGTVRDKSSFVVGKVASDGTVRDASNRIIGHAKGVPVRYAALFFFFDLTM